MRVNKRILIFEWTVPLTSACQKQFSKAYFWNSMISQKSVLPSFRPVHGLTWLSEHTRVPLTWKNMTSCLGTLENRRGRGSFMFTRITASCRPWRQALASHAKHNLQCLGYYTYNHSDFLFHQSAITDNVPGPHPSEWLCETEQSGGSSDCVSSHTVSRGVETGEMDILPEDPTDHSKKTKKKKTGVITLSYTQTFNLKRTHTLFTNAKKV